MAVRYDRIDTAIGTSRFATGSAMAYGDSYRLALILVGPVTTDTASFDHIGGLLSEDWKAKRTIAGRLCQRLNHCSQINVFTKKLTSESRLLLLMLPTYSCILPRCELDPIALLEPEAPLLNT